MRHRARLTFTRGLALVAALLATGFARAAAQNPPPADAEPRFEVASIKRQRGGSAIGVQMLPNGITASLSTVRMLIMSAYQVADYQVAGGPSWMLSDRFEISARAPGEVTPEVARRMLKNLLQDRLALRARTETREVDVYSLMAVRGEGQLGPGLRRTRPECGEATQEARKKGVVPPGCVRTSLGSDRAGGAIYSMGAVALERLVSQISGHVGGPVVDRTGLTGLFDIRLEFADQRRLFQPRPAFAKDSGLPTLRDALEEQLGLRLETGKGPIEVVVVESLERPSEN